MLPLLFLATGLSVFAAVYLVGRRWNDAIPADQQRAIHRLRALDGAVPVAVVKDHRLGSLKEIARAIGARLAPRDGKARQDLQTRLTHAGFRQESAPFVFNTIQLSLVVGIAIVATAIALICNASWRMTLLAAAGAAAIGLLAPSIILNSIMNGRIRTLRRAFPDMLDLLVLSIEGGSSANAALAFASEELPSVHPLLGEEIANAQNEVQLGLPPSEAFLTMANRCGLTEARELSAALLQSERYGASLAKAVRSFSESARLERQMWAEEVAQKASVKIIFPMLLCIFPAIFIVLLGPASAQMARLFSKGGP